MVSAEGTIGLLLIILNVGIPLIGIIIALYDVGVDAAEEIKHPKSESSKADDSKHHLHEIEKSPATDSVGSKCAVADSKPAAIESSVVDKAENRESIGEGRSDDSPVAKSILPSIPNKNAKVFPSN